MKRNLFTFAILFCCSRILAQTILGVDVSALQGTITWSQVASAGKTFAFVKATKGTCYTDSRFSANITGGHAANVVVGAYDFALPEDNTATAEANYFLNAISGYTGCGYLPPVLDLEDPAGTCIVNSQSLTTYFSSSALTSWVQTWVNTVQASTGRVPIIYTTSSIASYLGSSLNNCKLWIANPGTSATTQPSSIGNWNTWAFKQYDWYGTVSGITGNVDLDVFNGTTADFNTLICTSTTAPVCNNDNPCSPQSLTINSSCSPASCSTVNATASNISYSGASTCSTPYQSGRYDDDVWFSITPSNTNPVTITVTPTSNTSNFDASVGLYSGNCSSPTQVTCADQFGVGQAETMTFTPTAGTTYLIRVFSYGIGSTYSGNFNICATGGCTAPTAPTSITTSSGNNNYCVGSAYLTLFANGQLSSGAQWHWYTGGCGSNSAGSGSSINVSPSSSTTYYVRAENGTCYSNCVSLTVNTYNSPTTPTITGDQTICSGGTAALSISNPCSGCTYSWSGGGSGTSYSPSTAGTYYVTATNSCGTATSTGWTVTNSNLNVSASAAPASVCAGQTFTVTANGNANNYVWSGQGLTSNTGNSVSGALSASGSYTFTVTGYTGGCTASATTSVNVSLPPNISINPGGQVSLCSSGSGSSVVLQASGANSYSWSPSTGLSSTSSASPTVSGLSSNVTYTVTGTAGGCTATNSVTVNVTQTPVVSISPASATICSGGTGVTLTVSGGAASYSWSPSTGLNSTSSSSVTANPSSATTYTVTASNNSCSATTSATITVSNQPTASILPALPSIGCGGGSVTLTASPSGSSYSWSGPSGFTGSGPSVIVSTPGQYSVTITNAGGCGTSAVAFTTVIQSAGLIVSAGSNSTISSGSSVTLGGAPTASGGNGSYTYNWSSVPIGFSSISGNPQVSPTVTTIYTVTASDGAGCSGTASVTITVGSGCANPPTANAGPDVTYSAGVQIGGNPTGSGGTGTLTYLWSPSAGLNSASIPNPTVSNIATTQIYTVTVTDANGCSATSSVTVSTGSCNNPLATPTLQINGCELSITPIANVVYQWYYNGTPQANTNSNSYTAQDSGQFYVLVTSLISSNCVAQSAPITLNCTQTSILNLEISDLSVVPNPSSGSFMVSFTNYEESVVEVRVYDLIGKLIWEDMQPSFIGFYNKQVSLSAVAKGTYILRIQAGDKSENRKILIQ